MPKQDPALPVPRLQPEAWMPEGEWQRRHLANVALAQKGEGKVVLYGASIIEVWQQDPSLALISELPVLALGLGGDNTQHLLWRLDHGETGKLDPDTVILNIGNNNFGHQDDSPEDVVRGILAAEASVKRHFPRARRVVLAITPNSQYPGDRLRVLSAQANELLKAAAPDRGYRCIDIGEAMLDQEGRVPAEWAPDFLHPTPACYERLARALRRALDEG